METASLQALSYLARLLETRKQAGARPYMLLLTSALSLTPALLHTVCGSADWSLFLSSLRRMSAYDRRLALLPLLRVRQYEAAYRSLAHLVSKGYFSTILTANVDSALEDALTAANGVMQAPQVFLLQRDPPEHIMQMLQEPAQGPRVLKLHGSLREGFLPERFPDFFDFRAELKHYLSSCFNQDILIVGSLEHEYDIQRMLDWQSQSSLYYVTEREEAYEELMCKLTRERGADPALRVFAGSSGQPDLFLGELERLLVSSPSASGHPPGAGQAVQVVHSLEEKPEAADILLVTVTEVETRETLRIFSAGAYQSHFIGDKTYYALGTINGARVFLVQSEMGTSGPGGSLLTISESIAALQPRAVIMPGIAFGLQPERQRIGDILVSQQLRGYELQRYGTDPAGTPQVLLRSDLSSASVRLLDRFRSGYKSWPGPARVSFGLMLSGEKLVDNQTFRDFLRGLEPEALGGEMEGVGLSSVAQRHKIDWILVKAICDWGDGNKARNKARNQHKAARNAALFTLHILQSTRLHP